MTIEEDVHQTGTTILGENNILAIILAAGQQKRLYPIRQPKCLLPFYIEDNLETPLSRQINELVDIGVDHIKVVVGYAGGLVKKALQKYCPDAEVIDNPHYMDRNNSYSMYLALTKTDDFVIMNGDAIFIGGIIKDLVNYRVKNVFPVEGRKTRWNKDLAEEMRISAVNINGKNYVKNISKEIPLKETFGQALGVYKLTAQVAESLLDIRQDINWDIYYEDVFRYYMSYEFSHFIETYKIRNHQRVIEIDTYEEYKRISR